MTCHSEALERIIVMMVNGEEHNPVYSFKMVEAGSTQVALRRQVDATH